MKKCCVICNRHGGHGITDEILNKIKNTLEDYNYETDFKFTEGCKDATRIIKDLDYHDLVISIGGDGTFSEVVSGNVMRKRPLLLSHLPNGTSNDIAHVYGLNKNIIINLKEILEGKIVEIDVPTINGIPFIYVCGYGKFLNIPYETPQDLKKHLGHMAYLISGFKDIFKAPKSYQVKYIVDGKKYEGKYTIFIVSNSTSVAGFRNFYTKDVDLTDGKVEIALLYSKNRTHLFNAMVELITGGVDNVKTSVKHVVKKFEIEFIDALDKKWDADGEKVDVPGNKFTFEVKHKVSLLLPKQMISKK